MDVISLEVAKVALIFINDEVRPMRGTYFPAFLEAIGTRYQFTTRPENDTGQSAVKFEHGVLKNDSGTIPINALTIYSDAILAETNTTDDSQVVVDDVKGLAKALFGFRDPKTPPLTVFESNIVVDFDVAVSRIIPAFDAVATSLSRALRETYDREFKIGIGGLGFASDPTELPMLLAPYLKPDFSIVRRTNRPYQENRFFCSATLPTGKHLELLREFETLVLAGEPVPAPPVPRLRR